MAAQLETFGLGRSINCLSAASLYAVHPHADVDVTARASRAFFGVFGGALQCELHTVLAKFNGATSLGEILQQVSSPVQDYMIDIVTWLLR